MAYGYSIKSCGKAHNFCMVCRPDLREAQRRAAQAAGRIRQERSWSHSEEAKANIRAARLLVVERKYQEKVKGWIAGELYETLPVFMRKWLYEQKGEACWECGWAGRHPITQRIMVQVHHVDGNNKNNRPNNLKVLCPNCHSLTDTVFNTKTR